MPGVSFSLALALHLVGELRNNQLKPEGNEHNQCAFPKGQRANYISCTGAPCQHASSIGWALSWLARRQVEQPCEGLVASKHQVRGIGAAQETFFCFQVGPQLPTLTRWGKWNVQVWSVIQGSQLHAWGQFIRIPCRIRAERAQRLHGLPLRKCNTGTCSTTSHTRTAELAEWWRLHLGASAHIGCYLCNAQGSRCFC